MPPETCMITEIKRQAYIDAVEYEMLCDQGVIPLSIPKRYETNSIQSYYESQFYAYLREIRGEGMFD